MKWIRWIIPMCLFIFAYYNADCAKHKKLIVTVFDKITTQPIGYAQVTVRTLQSGKEISTESNNTDLKGRCKFSVKIDDSYQYEIKTQKTGYFACTSSNAESNVVSEVILSSLTDKEISLFLTHESSQKFIAKSEATTIVTASDTISKAQGELDAIKSKRKESENPNNENQINKNINSTPAPTQQLKKNVAPSQDNSSSIIQKKTDYTWLWILIGIIALVLWITIIRYNRKCDKCGKWNSMKTVEKETVEKIKSNIKKVLKEKDSQGRVTKTKEISVPATIYKYHIHRECKHCGHKDIIKKTEKVEN